MDLDAATIMPAIEYFAKLDSPTGVALFVYLSYRFKRFEDRMQSLNDKLEKLVNRVVKLEESVDEWLFTE